MAAQDVNTAFFQAYVRDLSGRQETQWKYCVNKIDLLNDLISTPGGRNVVVRLVLQAARGYLGENSQDLKKRIYLGNELILPCKPDSSYAEHPGEEFLRRLQNSNAAWTEAILTSLRQNEETLVETQTRMESTLQGWMDLMTALLNADDRMNTETTNYIDNLFCHYVATITSAGNVSSGKAVRLSSELAKEFNSSITISLIDVDAIWTHCERYITSSTMTAIFGNWKTLYRDRINRLHILVEQSTFRRMTIFTLIIKAIKEVPDFAWGKIRTVLKGEFVNLDSALDVVGTSKFYGYNRDDEKIYIAKFPGLGYTAVQLLTRIGEDNLRNYRGLDGKRIPNRMMIDTLIRKWEDQRRSEEGSNIVVDEEAMKEFQNKIDAYAISNNL